MRLLAWVLAVAAVIELVSALLVVAMGPMTWHIGPVPVLLHSAGKSVVIAIVIASLALAVAEPTWSAERRERLASFARVLAYAALATGWIALAAPYLVPGFVMGHDGAVHQTYAFMFDRALRQGQVPVRWVEGIAHGLGQPLFNYYQVGFYYLVSLVHAVGLQLGAAFKLVVISQWAIGSLFIILLCRPFGEMPAALAASVFLWSPYLLLDVYVRTAYPELTAIAFAAGVLWALDRLLRTGRPRFFAALAALIAFLQICHLPTTVIVAPAAALYAISVWLAEGRPGGRAAAVLGSALLGSGIAAFYTMPAILELDLVKIRQLTAGYFDYHQHFVQPRWWVDWSWGYGGSASGTGQMSTQIGIAQWAALLTATLLLATPALRRRSRASALLLLASMAAIGASMFMMTSASAPIWERVSPLAFIQFPWRLLMIPTLLCPILAAAALSAVRGRTLQALVVVCAVAVQWHLTDDYRAMAWTQSREPLALDDPAWPTSDLAKRAWFREVSYDPLSVTGTLAPTRERWALADATTASADVSVIRATDASLTLAVRTDAATDLVINTPVFPGWRVSVDAEEIRAGVQPTTGYAVVTIPAGTHRVEAAFHRDGLRGVAEAIAVASMLILVAILVWPSAWRRRASTVRAAT